jgi:hypothetical protein
VTDLNEVPSSQQKTHEDLMEWARWCGSGRGTRSTHPMFRGYVPYLYPEPTGGARPVDVLLALAVQRAFVRLPERHRAVLSWAYCYPWINPGRVQRSLAVTREGLAKLLLDSRTMMGNTVRAKNPASAVPSACAGGTD